MLANHKKMPECREKACPASAFLLVFSSASPASAFRYQGQSGTADHGLVGITWLRCVVRKETISISGLEKKDFFPSHLTLSQDLLITVCCAAERKKAGNKREGNKCT
jgi:hypothetical protein